MPIVVTLAIALAACSDTGPARGGPSTLPSSTSAGPPAASPPTTDPPVTTSTSSVTTLGPPPDLSADPVWDLDFPDPFVLATLGRHYAFATTSGRIQVQRLDAGSLEDWRGPSEVLPDLPSWASDYSSWAPALLASGDGYLLYYTARVEGTDQHCISYAEGSEPDGPFVDDSERPWLCPVDLGGAIDPSPFVDADGAVHLLWKNDGVTLRRESAIWSQPLTRDGRSFVGEPVRLIETDQDWEYPHIEAPSMARVDGTYWLAYSANWWNQPAYGVGLARCTSPTGPCEKPFDGPVLASTDGAQGPGGAEFFVDERGRVLWAYHAWTDEPGYPGHRALHVGEPRLLD